MFSASEKTIFASFLFDGKIKKVSQPQPIYIHISCNNNDDNITYEMEKFDMRMSVPKKADNKGILFFFHGGPKARLFEQSVKVFFCPAGQSKVTKLD